MKVKKISILALLLAVGLTGCQKDIDSEANKGEIKIIDREDSETIKDSEAKDKPAKRETGKEDHTVVVDSYGQANDGGFIDGSEDLKKVYGDKLLGLTRKGDMVMYQKSDGTLIVKNLTNITDIDLGIHEGYVPYKIGFNRTYILQSPNNGDGYRIIYEDKEKLDFTTKGEVIASFADGVIFLEDNKLKAISYEDKKPFDVSVKMDEEDVKIESAMMTDGKGLVYKSGNNVFLTPVRDMEELRESGITIDKEFSLIKTDPVAKLLNGHKYYTEDSVNILTEEGKIKRYNVLNGMEQVSFTNPVEFINSEAVEVFSVFGESEEYFIVGESKAYRYNLKSNAVSEIKMELYDAITPMLDNTVIKIDSETGEYGYIYEASAY